jgi:glycine/D-amino acid oxidase-like deaminating enzyme
MSHTVKLTLLALILVTNSVLAYAEPEIRKVSPPNLEESHLGKRITCYRPMRHGSPNMSVEKKESQIIAHNYGHGGSGWTLAPGTAKYVNDLLLDSSHAVSLSKDTKIVVIGAGAIGLFTAYDLVQRGYKNITIIAEKFESLTSHNAGGLLTPSTMDNNQEAAKIIEHIEIEAYKFYASIARREHSELKDGAVIVPTYFLRNDQRLEPYVGKVMQPAKEVIVDFSNGTKREMKVYDDGIFIDTAKMMSGLTKYLKTEKIKFIQKKIKNFHEIDAKYIINCAGLGARELNNDNRMESVQGHLIMLKDQKDFKYMISLHLENGVTPSGQKIKRSFYMFPKHLDNTEENDVGVVGGTFIEGATEVTPNLEEFDIMLGGAKKFFGIK